MAATRQWCIAATLAVAALATAAEPAMYALNPVFRKPGDKLSDTTCGSRILHFDKNRAARMDFATTPGTLCFRMLPDKIPTGPHEIGYKFLVDRNGDGKINEADGEAVAKNEVFSVAVTLGGKPFQYPLSIIQVYSNSSGEHAYCAIDVASMVYLEGQVGPTTVRLYDTNCSGRFGDVAGGPADGKDDLLAFGAKREARPVSKCVALPDGKLRDVEIVGGGAAIRLLPHSGAMVSLTVRTQEEWRVQTRLRHIESGFETDASSGTKVVLPPGAYKALWPSAQWTPASAAAGGRDKSVPPTSERDSQSRDARPAIALGGLGSFGIQLNEGENTLTLGPPFKLDFTAARSTEDDADIEVTEVALVGAGGDRYRPRVFSAGGAKTISVAVRAGGEEQRLRSLAYG